MELNMLRVLHTVGGIVPQQILLDATGGNMNRFYRFGFPSLALALAILLLPVAGNNAFAQTETGLINGTVTDQSGAVVPGAKVTVRNVGTNAERLSGTDTNGFYSVSNLLPGIYSVTVESANLAKKEARTEVTVGARVSLNFQLSVGATSTIVEVTAEGGVQVDTESQTIGTVIDSQLVQELPSNT